MRLSQPNFQFTCDMEAQRITEDKNQVRQLVSIQLAHFMRVMRAVCKLPTVIRTEIVEMKGR